MESIGVILGNTSTSADKIAFDFDSLARFGNEENVLSDSLGESVKGLKVFNLSSNSEFLYDYLEYLKYQGINANSVHLHFSTSKYLDLSEFSELPEGLNLKRFSVGKLKSK